MTWIFERGAEQLTWEVRRNAVAYEIAVCKADGSSRVQQLDTPNDLLSQIAVVPQALLRAGFRPRPAVVETIA